MGERVGLQSRAEVALSSQSSGQACKAKAKFVPSLARLPVEIFFRFHQLPPLTTLTDPRRRPPTPSTLPKRTLEE